MALALTYGLLSMLLFVLFMFTRIPALYELFNVTPSEIDPLSILSKGFIQ